MPIGASPGIIARMSTGISFGQAARAYARYRPDYPDALYDRVLGDRRDVAGAAIDLGAGTGLVTRALLRRGWRVDAVEPDAAMAAHIGEEASGEGTRALSADASARLRVHITPAESYAAREASADLIVSANAFHWMDRARVVEHAARWLRDGGIFAVWRYGLPRPSGPAAALFARELAERWAPFVDPRAIGDGRTADIIERQPELTAHVHVVVANCVHLDRAQALGFLASISFVAAYLRTLQAPDRYLAALGDRIEALSGPTLGIDLDLELHRAVRGSR